MKTFIAVAGNIGAGKTSLCEKLEQHFHWERYQEPFNNNPYLESFYKDMERWAFQTEMAFLVQRLKNHREIFKKENNVIQDRCIYEGAEIFVKNLYLSKKMGEDDWQTYNEFYRIIKRDLIPPNLVIYVKSTPERCYKNIMKRNRDFEKQTDFDYLRNLHILYEEWQKNFNLCPVITADADQNDFKYNDNDFFKLTDQLISQLRATQKGLF